MLDKLSRLFRRDDRTPPATPSPKSTPAPTASAVPSIDERCVEVGQIDDRVRLLEIALHDKVARVRLAAAQRLSAPDDLDRLRRDSSDKAVQRHARDGLKAAREAEEQSRATQERVARLVAGIAQHAARSPDPLYAAKLDQLENAWRDVAGVASAADQERFAEHAALARDTLQQESARRDAHDAAISSRQEAIAACNELEAAVERLAREDFAAHVASVSALVATQRTRWEEALAVTAPDALLARRYRDSLARLERWLSAVAELTGAEDLLSALLHDMAAQDTPGADTVEQWQDRVDALADRLHWPDGFAAPALLGELDAARRRLGELQRGLRADRESQLRQLRGRRHALRKLVDEGQLALATRLHHALLRRIAGLSSADADAERRALAPTEEALARLHDWYAFASAPKKEELCAQMESLAASDDGPETNAGRVRALRAQWTALCAADPEADPALRARFEAAAERAWAPCAVWYAEQNRVREENLAHRMALCDELDALAASTDWANADWKAIEAAERRARDRWRQHEPVRWPAARPVQERFNTLIMNLRTRLEGARGAGADRRRELIAAAVTLRDMPDIEAAIAEARRLQQAWKDAGYTAHRQGQALWEEFRAAIDALYARRDEARDAERRLREEARAAERASEREEAAKRAQRAQALRDARVADIAGALALAEAEARHLAGASPDLAALDATMSLLTVRGPLADALRDRRALLKGATPDAATLTTNAARLAVLTLDLEIVADAPSPAEFAAARMARKVERLNASLRGGRNAGDERRALEDAWLAVGPVDGAVHAALLARARAAGLGSAR